MSQHQPAPSTTQTDRLPKIVFVIGIVIVVYALIAVALWAMNAASSPAAAFRARSPDPARTPLTLTLLHTNDTWGYVRPCG
jgi:hypothetical protein